MNKKLFRTLAAIGAPFAVIGFSIMLSIVTDALEQTKAGKALLLLILVGLLGRIAYAAWNWWGWDDDGGKGGA